MLIKHYKPYSKKRMTAFFKLLKEYGIDYNDEKKMNMLIEQTEQAKDKNNIIKVIKSRVNVVIIYIFLPIFGCVVEHIIGNMKIDQAFIQTIIFVTRGLIVFVTVLVVLLIGDSIFGGYLQEYDDLKYDLQQAMIFGNPYGEIISTSF